MNWKVWFAWLTFGALTPGAPDGQVSGTPGTTSGNTINVRSGTGVDWTPAGKVVNSTFTFSAALDWFAEYEEIT